MKDGKIGIVLLAAGESSRLGRPKQLLVYQGKTLLERAMESVLGSKAAHLVLVLGANASLIQKQMNIGHIPFLVNANWEKGMSGSMRIGLSFLMDQYQIDAAIIMLVDQPFADSTLLDKLIDQFQKGNKGIIASSYRNTLGVPALFNKKYFPELLALREKQGAKKIIFEHLEDVISIEFQLGEVDVDTEVDYQKLLNFRDDQGFL